MAIQTAEIISPYIFFDTTLSFELYPFTNSIYHGLSYILLYGMVWYIVRGENKSVRYCDKYPFATVENSRSQWLKISVRPIRSHVVHSENAKHLYVVNILTTTKETMVYKWDPCVESIVYYSSKIWLQCQQGRIQWIYIRAS